jgi:hypothetical protein
MFGPRDTNIEQPKKTDAEQPLHCSFCHKSLNIVRKLISSPGDYQRSYICDECIAVCQGILEDDGAAPDTKVAETKLHPLVNDAIASELLTAVENWIKQESLGFHANAEFAAVRRIALRLLPPADIRDIIIRTTDPRS